MVFRILVLSTIILLIDLYAFQALRLVSSQWNATLKIAVYLIFWAVPLVTIGFVTLYQMGYIEASSKGFFSIFRSILFIAYVSKLPLILFLLIDDLRRVVIGAYEYFNETVTYEKGRSNFLIKAGIFLSILPFTTLLYGIIRNRYRYKVFSTDVKISRLPNALKGLKIIQISDIHSGSFDKIEPVRKSVELINLQKPDLVLFTGDLVNSIATEVEDYVDVFKEIKAKYGVFSVLGNHDYGDYHRWENKEAKIKNLEYLAQLQSQMGWTLLRNENQIISINGEELSLIGVENYSASSHFPKYGDLSKAMKGLDPESIKILMTHDPSHWESQVLDTDIDLTLSGHTHGMQFGIEIPGIFKWSPIKYAYKQWAGLYERKGQFLYVNRGLGFLGYPGRVGILPEITVLNLV